MILKVDEIKLNPDNPRTIKDEKYQKLVTSLKEFPEMAEVREVVVNKDHVILGGNMRFRAMQEAGWTEIPVKVVDWPEDKQKEFIVKDNASFGEWDWDVIANQYELEDLEAWGIDVPEALLPTDEVEEDEAPEVDDSEPPKSKLGEIYQLGRHRVMCGDSTDKGNVWLLMNGAKADMVFTDPPYGIDVVKNSPRMQENKGYVGVSVMAKKKQYMTVINDEDTTTAKAFYETWKDQSINFIIWGGNYFTDFLPPSRGWVIWDKENDGNTWADAELAWTNQDKSIRLYRWLWSGMRKKGDRQTEERTHPTQKPVGLTAKIMEDWVEGKTVVDPFLGSGSTLIACEQTDRTCCGMELDPKYVDVIRKRYAKFISPTDWEDEWQALTPAISGGDQA